MSVVASKVLKPKFFLSCNKYLSVTVYALRMHLVWLIIDSAVHFTVLLFKNSVEFSLLKKSSNNCAFDWAFDGDAQVYLSLTRSLAHTHKKKGHTSQIGKYRSIF